MPAATPVTIPVDMPIVATAGLLLDHIPPVVASVCTTVDPTHTVDDPLMEAGAGLTEINACALPVPVVYVITATPAETPVT